jgi:hypothetical protein
VAQQAQKATILMLCAAIVLCGVQGTLREALDAGMLVNKASGLHDVPIVLSLVHNVACAMAYLHQVRCPVVAVASG